MGRIPERLPVEPPAPHKDTHKSGGSDEIDVSGLTPKLHKATHQDTGTDEISVAGLSGELADSQKSAWDKVSGKPATFTPAAHKATHQDTGTDEISVAGLSGELADDQPTTWDKVSGKPTDLISSGIIVMWSGSIATIPTGWALCNGSNGTPDLRDQFVVAAKQDDAGVAKTNITGSLTKSGAVAHTHSINGGGEHGHSDFAFTGMPGTPGEGQPIPESAGGVGSGHGHGASESMGIPPYYALAYIMKL